MAIPLSASEVEIYDNISFEADYKNVRYFPNRTQQLNWFASKSVAHREERTNLVYFEQSGKQQYTYKIGLPVDDLYNVNYMRFRNPEYSDKWYYAFITRVEGHNRQASTIHFIPDVYQTFFLDVLVKPSMVVREHRPLWNANGTPVVNTLDEGLTYGDDYDTVNVRRWLPYADLYFMVIVCKEVMHIPDSADNTEKGEINPILNGLPQPLTYYVHPFRLDGSAPQVSQDGQAIPLSPLSEVLKTLYKSEDATNNIVSLFITEYMGMRLTYEDGVLNLGDSLRVRGVGDTQADEKYTLNLRGVQDYDRMEMDFGNKYHGFKEVQESKLMMYPYCLSVLTDFKGNTFPIHNEFIDGVNLEVVAKGSMGVSNKVSYSVKNYGTDTMDTASKNIVDIEHGLINAEANDVPIISEYLSAYLQGNRNSLMNQADQISQGLEYSFAGSVMSIMGAMGTRNLQGGASAGLDAMSNANNARLQFEGMMAKQKDLSTVPPQVHQMGSNSAFDFGNRYAGLYVVKKQIKNEYIARLTDYFNKYGYKYMRVKIPNLNSRTNWNYVETSDINIQGAIGAESMAILKMMFNNGITLWHTDDIGNYSLSNGVRS